MFYLLLVGILFSIRFHLYVFHCNVHFFLILYYNIVILYLFFFLLISVLRPLHTESEVFACKKINTTFRCVNHACAPPPKNWIWFVFFFFFASVACILIGKDDEYEKMENRIRTFWTRCAMTFLIYIYQTLLSKATYNCIQVIHFYY